MALFLSYPLTGQIDSYMLLDNGLGLRRKMELKETFALGRETEPRTPFIRSGLRDGYQYHGSLGLITC